MRQNEGYMANELVAGDSAPDFELPTDGGGRAHLADLKGKPVVIYPDVIKGGDLQLGVR